MFYTGYRTKDGVYHEIFKNPTLSELKDLGQEIRFVAFSKTKELFVSDAELLHDQIYSILRGKEFDVSNPSISGLAAKKGSKYEVVQSNLISWLFVHTDFGYEKYIKTIKKIDWSWIDRYLGFSNWWKRSSKYL